MLTKKICLQALNDMKKYGGINIPPLAFDILDRLIETHFNPQPLRFCDLHENMWVFDMHIKCAIYITKIENNYINSEYEHHDLFCDVCGEDESKTYFEENRFYPVQIPIIGDKNEPI